MTFRSEFTRTWNGRRPSSPRLKVGVTFSNNITNIRERERGETYPGAMAKVQMTIAASFVLLLFAENIVTGKRYPIYVTQLALIKKGRGCIANCCITLYFYIESAHGCLIIILIIKVNSHVYNIWNQ